MSRSWTSTLEHIAYLGPPATHSHQAALAIGFPAASLNPKHSIQGTCASKWLNLTILDVFLAVQSGIAAYGVVPYENSTFGSVMQTLDALADRECCLPDISIVAEVYLPVHHYLVGHQQDHPEALHPPSGDSTPTLSLPMPVRPKVRPIGHVQHIKRIYSHPQAFGQCQAFLSTYFRGAECLEAPSTARAAEIVSLDGSKASAAISTEIAADVHNLSVFARGIEDSDDNCTRFFIISKASKLPASQQSTSEILTHTEPFAASSEPLEEAHAEVNSEVFKVLISLTLDHSAPSALVNALLLFNELNLNLTNLGNRPSKIRPWHYIFFVEFEAKKSKLMMAESRGMSTLNGMVENCKWHGAWPSQNRAETESEIKQRPPGSSGE